MSERIQEEVRRKGADWEMKRAEVNSRKEVGRGEGKTVQDDGKTGDLSINYNTIEAVIDWDR